MDRRSSLAVMFGKKQTAKKTTTVTPPLLSSLSPYTGTWDMATAKHLLGRTMYGPTYAEIKQSANDGLASTIAKLFTKREETTEPIYFDFENDPNVPLGETWVNIPPARNIQNLNGARNRSNGAWLYGLMLNGGVSIREKMVLFWHNHFVVGQVARNQYEYWYMNTFRENATGNFKTITEAMTIDPAMLVYLNGRQNTRIAPNENYARELLELFTIGKGDIAGPGDYTTFTEDDVIEIARALTGWVNTNDTPNGVGSEFVERRHDLDDKHLSHRFGNRVIKNSGDQEYKEVIDIIFEQDEVARFISRRLHIWFVGSNIDSFVEAEIIEPMAALIRDNNYEIQPALEALLSSEYFYEESIRGCMVSHPIDHMFRIIRTLDFKLPTGTYQLDYAGWLYLSRKSADFDMQIFNHPTVAGWKAFYQGPQYYDAWINSVSLPLREEFAEDLIGGFNVRINGDRIRFEFDFLATIAEMEDPSDPYALIEDLAKVLFPYPIAQNQLEYLTDFLIQGNQYYVWSLEYNEYLTDPTNNGKREAILGKLSNMIEAMLKMPEFYLI